MSRESEELDKEALLAALQAHGQQFMSAFGSFPTSSTHPQRKRRKLEHDSDEETRKFQNGEDEWRGFSAIDSHRENEDTDADGNPSSGEEIEGDDSETDTTTGKHPEVIVFHGPSTSKNFITPKLQSKAFMSSKVSKLREDIGEANSKDDETEAEDYEEERTNLQNDALLHKLVHTQLLSGSLNSEMNMTPAQKRKALEGRILELAGSAKLGKGESLVRDGERKKASKRVRLGLEKAVEDQKVRALEQAKDLGNYHQSIKHLFDAPSKDKANRRKREHGLKLGVGKFTGGVLKLSRDEIASVQGIRDASQGKGKGRNSAPRRK